MKNKMIPDYPIMYKMNFTNGQLMKFQFDDFLYSYMSIREKEQCVCQGLITAEQRMRLDIGP